MLSFPADNLALNASERLSWEPNLSTWPIQSSVWGLFPPLYLTLHCPEEKGKRKKKRFHNVLIQQTVPWKKFPWWDTLRTVQAVSFWGTSPWTVMLRSFCNNQSPLNLALPKSLAHGILSLQQWLTYDEKHFDNSVQSLSPICNFTNWAESTTVSGEKRDANCEDLGGNITGRPVCAQLALYGTNLSDWPLLSAFSYTFITFAAAKLCCQVLVEVLTVLMLQIQN